jgi:outer membrane biosynthesis protein TonB
MQPIQINVQVNVGLNAELYTLLSAVLNRPAQVAELPAAPKPSKPAKPQPKPEVANKPTEDKAAAAMPEPEAPANEPQPEPAPAPEPQPQNDKKEYTEVDVRAAMDRTRRRIEGENYKEKTDSEGYKRWHRTLTGWFKNTAAMFGAEKPSALPDSESRAKFIACCDAVTVKNDELVEDCPF